MYPLETLCQSTFAAKIYECQFDHSLEAPGDLDIHTWNTHTHECVCVFCVCVSKLRPVKQRHSQH